MFVTVGGPASNPRHFFLGLLAQSSGQLRNEVAHEAIKQLRWAEAARAAPELVAGKAAELVGRSSDVDFRMAMTELRAAGVLKGKTLIEALTAGTSFPLAKGKALLATAPLNEVLGLVWGMLRTGYQELEIGMGYEVTQPSELVDEVRSKTRELEYPRNAGWIYFALQDRLLGPEVRKLGANDVQVALAIGFVPKQFRAECLKGRHGDAAIIIAARSDPALALKWSGLARAAGLLFAVAYRPSIKGMTKAQLRIELEVDVAVPEIGIWGWLDDLKNQRGISPASIYGVLRAFAPYGGANATLVDALTVYARVVPINRDIESSHRDHATLDAIEDVVGRAASRLMRNLSFEDAWRVIRESEVWANPDIDPFLEVLLSGEAIVGWFGRRKLLGSAARQAAVRDCVATQREMISLFRGHPKPSKVITAIVRTAPIEWLTMDDNLLAICEIGARFGTLRAWWGIIDSRR